MHRDCYDPRWFSNYGYNNNNIIYDETERLVQCDVARDCMSYTEQRSSVLKILSLPLDLHNSDITHRRNECARIGDKKKCKNKKHSCGCRS